MGGSAGLARCEVVLNYRPNDVQIDLEVPVNQVIARADQQFPGNSLLGIPQNWTHVARGLSRWVASASDGFIDRILAGFGSPAQTAAKEIMRTASYYFQFVVNLHNTIDLGSVPDGEFKKIKLFF